MRTLYRHEIFIKLPPERVKMSCQELEGLRWMNQRLRVLARDFGEKNHEFRRLVNCFQTTWLTLTPELQAEYNAYQDK